ncbi:10813_t:CDS:2 [Funneliformis caledonium]|uniref:10813_t:CDS:1 n=1 Tax=Funneliformis caledonium TaxID=1117310 RepID=A0A9N9EY91_9GLOM|nr:10813_t:CDS:2 [Funneliformis caledonium]
MTEVSIPVAAIYEHQSGGLNFGGGDLNVNDRIVSCQKSMQSYEHRILDIDNYLADEFEVFSITTNFI